METKRCQTEEAEMHDYSTALQMTVELVTE